ncbi:MAG: formate acetyltransferase [Lachnospiraceae bacterium]|nr:formate acetyltransferase [Lachnospiraceae bacterium]MBR4058817.1 formate acetyltransferase [Lachnospiraceae bacterium]
MSAIKFINQFPAEETFDYDKRIKLLRKRKVEQTEEKARNGGANEDDYGLIVQDEFQYKLKPNHENGSIYGYKAWTENYCAILDSHPLYCDPLDAFVGKGFLFLERLRPVTCKWNPAYPFDELKVLFDKYNVISGIDNCHHFTPDLQIGFDLGWGGILQKLKEQRALHDESHYEFYDSEIAVVEAIIRFLKRCAAELKELGDQEQNLYLKENLYEMSRVNKKVADGKPETFREAVQWMCWFSMLSRTYNRGSAGGQLDEMLRPYYEKDIAEGILTDEEAVFYLACLFLQDSRYFQLGGPDINGEDMTSKISYLCLDAADKINIACNLTIRVHDKLDEKFFKKSVAYLFKNKQGWPRYSSDSALAEGFMKCGYSLEMARKRVAAGCHWMCIPGMEYTMNDTVKINLLKVFEVAYQEMMADKSEAPSSENLWKRYEKHLKVAVDATGNGIMHHLKYQSKSQPELILNLFQHGLIEKGVNITDGGANYYNMCVDGSGLAVVADSFAACEQRIEKEKKLTYEALTKHIANNFEDEDGEYIRQLMQHSEKYCGGDSLGDIWAKRVSKLYTELVRDLNVQHPGINFIPGFFSWSNTLGLGSTVGATPNGRKAGEAINHGANPNGGFRKDGAVSSMCNSIGAIQPGYGNCAPVQLEFDPGIVNDAEGVDKMAAMIKTIMNTGNTLLNINIIDANKILEAHKDPFKYPDLVVRVTGFTAFFAMLTPEFRQLVVDRVTSVNGNKINVE